MVFFKKCRPYPCSFRQARLMHIQVMLYELWVFRGEKAHEVGRGKWYGIGDKLEGTEWEVGLIQTYCMHVWVLNKISFKGGLTEECLALNGTSISKAQGSTWKRGREGYKVHR